MQATEIPNRRSSERLKIKDCQATLVLTDQHLQGKILDVSQKGVSLLTTRQIAIGEIALIEFDDVVTKKKMHCYVRVLHRRRIPFSVKINRLLTRTYYGVFLGREAFYYEYGCQVCTELETSSSFEEFYDRILSDQYVNQLNKQSAKEKSKGKIKFKIAETAFEKEAAYRLVHKEYLKRGITNANAHEMYIRFHALVPSATTFIGVINGEVVMTMSSVVDSPIGLPMDKRFGEILEPIREQGRKLVEFGMLALDYDLFGKGAYALKHYKKMSTLFSLYRFVVRHAMCVHGSTDVVIGIFAWYKKLYSYLLFESIGERTYYEENNDWIYPYRLNLTNVTARDFMSNISRIALMRYFFGQKMDPKQFATQHHLTKWDIEYLFVRKSNLLELLKDEEMEKLRVHHRQIADWILELKAGIPSLPGKLSPDQGMDDIQPLEALKKAHRGVLAKAFQLFRPIHDNEYQKGGG